jgi:hypothetical protein
MIVERFGQKLGPVMHALDVYNKTQNFASGQHQDVSSHCKTHLSRANGQ